MRRRKLLAAAVLGGFAGCSMGTGDNATETPTRTHTETPTDTETPADTEMPTKTSGHSFVEPTPTGDVGRIETVRAHSLPESVPFEGRVTLLDQPTNDRGATIAVSLRNQDTRAWTLQTYDWGLPFHTTICTGRHLVVKSETDGVSNGCPVGVASVARGKEDATVAAGEKISGERRILTSALAETCFAAGEHQFSNGYSVHESRGSDAEMSFDWGFDVVIAE